MDSTPPSEEDYAERMAIISNRMDIEMSNPETTGIPLTSPDNSLLHPPVHNETASNAALQPDPSTLPITPSVLPYEANVPSDPNLWDGHFGPISLFSMNEFLQSDACNISCSLLCMAEFIRQRNISNCNSNKIPQIDSFGEATFKFILASHEAGWDRLNTLDKTPLETKSNCNLLTLPHPITVIKTLEKTWLLKSLLPSQHASLANNWKKLRNIWNKGKKIRRTLPTNHMPKPSP